MPSPTPETRYAKSGDVNIAYQVVGAGPLDLVYVPGWVSHLELASAMGDDGWKQVLKSYYDVARREVKRFRGREIDTAGDGFFASFEAPAEAVRCAQAMVDALWKDGIPIRAGLHTGECERLGDKLGGLAVNIGARVASLAGPGEVLVSSTVKDLVAGSGLAFDERGEHELKGVPGTWRLYAVADA